jgi:hypothetical protein
LGASKEFGVAFRLEALAAGSLGRRGGNPKAMTCQNIAIAFKSERHLFRFWDDKSS